jgi:hypothetical protein
MSNDNLDIVPEWVLELTKGGPGSGEHAGHPFRGNGSTGAITQAFAHDPRGDEHMSYHEHLDMATARIMAAQAAHAAGRYGEAMHHFNMAARHGAWAAQKLNANGADKSLHQSSKTLYAAAHHAGDMEGLANKSTRALAAAVRRGADQNTVSMLAGRATIATHAASLAANTAMAANSEIADHRMANALMGAQSSAQ